jgi:hypothetical protein
MNFYTSVFKNAKVGGVSQYGEGAPFPKGTVVSASFELEGQKLHALNGGPGFAFSPAISFFIRWKVVLFYFLNSYSSKYAFDRIFLPLIATQCFHGDHFTSNPDLVSSSHHGDIF